MKLTKAELDRMRLFAHQSGRLKTHEQLLIDHIDALDEELNQAHRRIKELHCSTQRKSSRIDALEAELERFKWIPVTERLPTKEDANEQGEVFARGHWPSGQPYVSASHVSYIRAERPSKAITVTHWMPIPKWTVE